MTAARTRRTSPASTPAAPPADAAALGPVDVIHGGGGGAQADAEQAEGRPEPRTARGRETKRKLLEAAEQVFAEQGYADASIVKITECAGVGQGTFYLYFESKLELFEALVDDLNRRVRRAMTAGAARGTTRLDAEAEGFRAFFKFTATHPALYRVIREAEYVAPGAMRRHYTRIVTGYIDGLTAAREAGEIGSIDPTVAAWALMGIGEMVGMRWVLWRDDPNESGGEVPEYVFDELMRFIRGAVGARDSSSNEPPTTPGGTSVPRAEKEHE